MPVVGAVALGESAFLAQGFLMGCKHGLFPVDTQRKGTIHEHLIQKRVPGLINAAVL